ncbi:MAG: hypothetical protein R3A80_00595 [Bdellovibrionota bacterium]
MNNIFTHPSFQKSILFQRIALVSVLLPLLLQATPPTNFSGDPVFFLGPIGQSLGGSVYSHKSLHDNLLVNPSAGSFGTEYAAEGSFSTAAKTIGLSVFDTKSTTYGGGLTYLRREVGSGDAKEPLKAGNLNQTYQSFGLSLFGKLHESFAVGVTGRYSMRDATGAADANGKSWNGDVSATFRVNDKIGIGASYKNLFGDSKDIEIGVIGGGAHVEIVPGLIAVGSIEKYTNPSDTPKYGVPDEDKISWSLGGQYSHPSGVSVRGSFREAGPWDSQLMFAGVGYVDKGFHVNYAFGTATKGDSFNVHTFGLGATF